MLGKEAQVDPIIPTSKPPGIKRLKPSYDEPPSNFAFQIETAPLPLGNAIQRVGSIKFTHLSSSSDNLAAAAAAAAANSVAGAFTPSLQSST
jgi:hypothetical protein